MGSDLKTDNETTLAARPTDFNKHIYGTFTGQCLCKQAPSHGNDLRNNIRAVPRC
jgi:hypothetical protein